MNRKLRSFLRRRGATPEEIAQAEREGRLLVLAFDYHLMAGHPRYTFAAACQQAGSGARSASPTRRRTRGYSATTTSTR
jgi:hypothetical protein